MRTLHDRVPRQPALLPAGGQAFAAGQLSPDTLYAVHPDDAEGFAASHHLSCRVIGAYHACHMEPQGGGATAPALLEPMPIFS